MSPGGEDSAFQQPPGARLRAGCDSPFPEFQLRGHHTLEAAAMQHAGADLLEDFSVAGRAVAEVLLETVFRVQWGQSPHEAIAHYLRHHGSCRHGRAFVVASDDGTGPEVGTLEIETVHQARPYQSSSVSSTPAESLKLQRCSPTRSIVDGERATQDTRAAV